MTQRPLLALLILMASIVVLAAQTPLTFRALTDYVQVDAVVTDGHGQPISDLTADDFRIYDTGRPQTVAEARFVHIPVQRRELTLDQLPGAERDVATNAPPAADSRAFVVIVDDLHLIPSTIPNIQKVLMNFVAAVSATDEVAILFVGHSNLSQDFTNDTGKLRRTIASVKSAFGLGIGVAATLQVEEFPYDRAVVWEIRNVAEALASSTHSRRAIVFVGAFSQLNPAAEMGTTERGQVEMLQRFTDDAWAAARRADVPIYTIDPRGIPTDENAVAGGRPNYVSPETDAALNAAAPQSLRAATVATRARWTYQQDHLVEMSANTGGKAFINRSDLPGAVDELMADNSSFYELGYYPSPSVHDGQFHEIKVSVSRPDAHIRVTKNGYVAMGQGDAVVSSLSATLDKALGNGLDVSGLLMRASATPMLPTKTSLPAVVTLEVSYPLPSGEASFSDDLQVTVLGLDSDGQVKTTATRPWHVSGQTPHSGVLTYMIDDIVDLPARPLTLRIGAISRLLGRAGTVQLSIDPPKMSGKAPQMSGILLGVANDSSVKTLGLERLRGAVPFQPTVNRVFARADRIRVYGRCSWSGNYDSATATVLIAGNVSPASTLLRLVPDGEADGRRLATIDASLPLQDAAPGDYVVSVTVTLPNGQRVVRAIPISVK